MLALLGCLVLASTAEDPQAARPAEQEVDVAQVAEVPPPAEPPPPEEELGTWRPFQLSLYAPTQLFPERDDVFGLRLSFGMGANRRVFGIDLGVVNVAEEAAGLQVAVLWNFTRRDVWGLQLSVLSNFMNSSTATFTGLRVALLNLGSELRGVEVGLLNVGFRLFGGAKTSGLQVGALNLTSKLTGVQVGLYNETRGGQGVQLGLINIADDFRGLQVGLVNYIRTNRLPFLPLVNASL